MPKPALQPPGAFPTANLAHRLAAVLYDSFLCVALLIVVGFLYKLLQMGIYGEAKLRQMADAGALDGDPLLSTLLLLSLFAFFAKFWMHGGQTLGMQVWGIRVQNVDGSAIGIQQALLRFMVAAGSWLAFGLGFWWILIDGQRRSWHDIYSSSVVVKLPKNAHRK